MRIGSRVYRRFKKLYALGIEVLASGSERLGFKVRHGR